MILRQLLHHARIEGDNPELETQEVRGISEDSRQVKEGYLFVAIRGAEQDGHQFIPEALKRGASACLVETSYQPPSSEQTPFLVRVEDTRSALIRLATAFYNHPSRKIKVIGVTGTNGKTTITYILEHLLMACGFKVGVMGTINHRFPGYLAPSDNTTPSALKIQGLLYKMLEAGCDYCVMEVSSHALDQDRVGGVDFCAGIFTNLSQDHLDYHGNLQNYFRAKAKLFKSLQWQSLAMINIDNVWGRRLCDLTQARVITYGLCPEAEISAADICFKENGTSFNLVLKDEVVPLYSRFKGLHNIYNMLSVAGLAWGLGLPLDIIRGALGEPIVVPGRLQQIQVSQPFHVFIDYAHTPDALHMALKAVRCEVRGRVILVFGCGGNRDKQKRPLMGKVASLLADYVIVTNDNPRREDPSAIVSQIAEGLRGREYEVILSRKEAISRALSLAQAEDVVLIAGKGHEAYQIFGDKRSPFSDISVVREYLIQNNYPQYAYHKRDYSGYPSHVSVR